MDIIVEHIKAVITPPLEIIKGCVEAVAEYNIIVTLTGDETKIKNVFSENSLSVIMLIFVIVPENHNGRILLSLFLEKGQFYGCIGL